MFVNIFKCFAILVFTMAASPSGAQTESRPTDSAIPQVESIALIFLKVPVPMEEKLAEIVRRAGTQDEIAMKIMGDRIAKVMANAGMKARYVGSFDKREDFAETLTKNDGEFKLVYVPKSAAYSTGGNTPRSDTVTYVVSLYAPGSSASIYQTFTTLGRHPMATMQDMFTRRIIQGLKDAKLYSTEGKTIIRTPIGELMPEELMARP